MTEPVGWMRAVVVDAVDPKGLATFWQAVLGVGIVEEQSDWIQLEPDRGRAYLAFQPVADPATAGTTRLRIDLEVDDMDQARTAPGSARGPLRVGDPRAHRRVALPHGRPRGQRVHRGAPAATRARGRLVPQRLKFLPEGRLMEIVHLYTGDDGRSHFADVELVMKVSVGDSMFEQFAGVQGMGLRDVPEGFSNDFHTAPRRQLVVNLSGSGEIRCGDGSVRIMGPGDVFLCDDTTGEGHHSREISGPRRQLYVYLDPELDLRTIFAT